MADAIDNLVQDINQNNTSVDEFPGYPGYQLGQEVPGMAGVRIGDLFYGLDPYGQEAPYNWRTGGFEFQAAPQDLSNPSTLATGGEIDYNVRDQPVERINIGNTDEQDAFVGGVYTPQNQQQYIKGENVLVPPGDLGGTIGVVDANPSDFAGQTPSSLPEEFITRGETVKIPGRGLPDYVPIGQMENGDVLYADRNNLRDTIIRPSAYSISQEDLDKGIVPQKFNFGINTELAPSQKTPTSVGAVEPATTSQGGFDNTGGNVTADPDNRAAGPGGTINVTPDWKEEVNQKPNVENDIDGDGIPDQWRIFTGGKGKDDGLSDYRNPKGEEFPTDQNGYKWNYRTGQFDCVGGKCSEKPPGEGTTKPPVVNPPVVNPPTGGGQPPGGGTKPGGVITGTGIGTYTGTPLPTREPVTPLIRRETVIPTKGTKEVPLPDRQADPFAKLYADLLANSQQQQDQYRYINYDPDQIMNAAMSGFRRRGAMRSLQGY